MTLSVTALLGGVAAGAATGGWLVEHTGTVSGYAAPMSAAALALVVAAAGTHFRRPSGAEPAAPPSPAA